MWALVAIQNKNSCSALPFQEPLTKLSVALQIFCLLLFVIVISLVGNDSSGILHFTK